MNANSSRWHPQGALVLAAVISLAVTVLMVGCGSRVTPTLAPTPLDLTTVALCPGEWGPGPDGTPVPCAFGPNHPGQVDGPREGFTWVLYVAGDVCPVTVQTSVRCLTGPKWRNG